MNDLIRPNQKPPREPAPPAGTDAREAERDEGEPGIDENAAGFLKSTTDQPAKE